MMNTFRADINAANDNRTRLRWRIVLITLAVLIALGTLGYFMMRDYLFEGLPSLPTKETMWEMNLQPNVTLLDDQGREIGHRGPYVGRPLKLAEMPPFLPNAFLAIEDERFYEHGGYDRKAILRAFVENTRTGKTVQGGSTLTQQLVKNMLLSPKKDYRRKFQEMWLANEMEQVLSKPEIIELYLNRISLGKRVFGVEAAAQRYFGKSATDITLPEAAMLAAMPKAPSRFDPTQNYDGAWSRAKLVLQRMVANNMISVSQMAEAENTPPKLAEDSQNLVDETEIGYVFDYITERAEQLVGSTHKDLVILTSLNTKFQKHAGTSLENVLAKKGKKLNASEGALIMLDNHNGEIKAMIGGRDYTQTKFNRAVQAERQPGSSFKAFVYAAALEEGYSPATVRIDQPVNIGGWQPKNYTRRYRGPMTIREALRLSINTVAATVGAEVGPTKVASLAKRFGISTPMRRDNTISLGASEATLLDMTRAYMVFANRGLKRPAYIIREVQNSAGEELYKHKDLQAQRVYADTYARQMVGMLRDVVEEGTGRGAQLGKRKVAGKTGTSQDFRDAWFIGFSSDYTTGVWMGNDDNSPMKKVTGGLLPADVWKSFMTKSHKNIPSRPLIVDDPQISDEGKRKRMDFYAVLVQSLLEERNLAAGISAGSAQPAAQTQDFSEIQTNPPPGQVTVLQQAQPVPPDVTNMQVITPAPQR